MKRILLFLATNLAVVAVLSVVARVTEMLGPAAPPPGKPE